jgi:4-hydroxybenzoate polyprenyltransferase
MPDFLQLMRPRQWPKNLLVLAALLFSHRFTELHAVAFALAALLSFLLLSSSVYAFNDAFDRESDRKHPQKKNRPVASGRVSPSAALGFGAFLGAIGLGLAFVISPSLGILSTGYLAVSASYTLWLKHEVILDVFALAAGFVLRAAAGGLAIDVHISPWLLSCTLLLALFLVLLKRRAEIELLRGASASHRRALNEYSLSLLDQMIAVVASATVVAYSIYAFSAHASAAGGPWMMLTVPFVLYGIFRYLYLSHRHGLAGAPEQVLLSDRPMQINLLLWALCAGAILLITEK